MSESKSELPAVYVINAHGRQQIRVSPEDRLIDCLSNFNVPWSAVSTYLVPRSGGEPYLAACLDWRISDLTDTREIQVYFNRNVNPFLFSIQALKVVASEGQGEHSAEYLYQDLRNELGSTETYLKKLSPEECRTIIANSVDATIREHVPAGSEIIVGVSGGGDSNALLEGLSRITGHDLRIRPMIIKGIPDWDAGVPRAQALCDNYGLELSVVEERDVKTLLGIPADSVSLIDRFEREFPGDDFEFLGTLLIRLALLRRARESGAGYICTGLNLEDILCEAMFRLASGLRPSSFPVRPIGDVKLIFPLWLSPKKIIDGCFPRFSLENYDARYPCFSLGRNLYYSVVWSMQSQFPGFPEKLARGLSQTSMADPIEYVIDEQLGFHVERFVPFPLRQKFLKMIGAGGD